MQNIDKPYLLGGAGFAAPEGKSHSLCVFGRDEQQVPRMPGPGAHEVTDGTRVIAVEIRAGR